MVFSVVYLRRGASAGGFLWKAPGCENRASQSGLRGCVNRGSSRARPALDWTSPNRNHESASGTHPRSSFRDNQPNAAWKMYTL